MSRKPKRTFSSRSVLPAAAVLLVLLAGAAAHANRPVPYGDRVAVPGVSDVRPVGAGAVAADGLRLRLGPGLEAYDPRSGALRWSYRREGATALHVVRSGGDAVVLWDDGLVTAVRPDDHEVRWHRAVPGLAGWLRGDDEQAAQRRFGARLPLLRARIALQAVSEPQPWVSIITPELAMGFRQQDGDLRWTTRPLSGCVYNPWRTVRTDADMVVVRTCTGGWGDSSAFRGEVTGYEIEGRRWGVPAGPNALPRRVDGRRITLTDGPLTPPRVLDVRHGAPVTACGDRAAGLAAQPADGPCAALAAAPAATRASAPATTASGSSPADR